MLTPEEKEYIWNSLQWTWTYFFQIAYFSVCRARQTLLLLPFQILLLTLKWHKGLWKKFRRCYQWNSYFVVDLVVVIEFWYVTWLYLFKLHFAYFQERLTFTGTQFKEQTRQYGDKSLDYPDPSLSCPLQR